MRTLHPRPAVIHDAAPHKARMTSCGRTESRRRAVRRCERTRCTINRHASDATFPASCRTPCIVAVGSNDACGSCVAASFHSSVCWSCLLRSHNCSRSAICSTCLSCRTVTNCCATVGVHGRAQCGCFAQAQRRSRAAMQQSQRRVCAASTRAPAALLRRHGAPCYTAPPRRCCAPAARRWRCRRRHAASWTTQQASPCSCLAAGRSWRWRPRRASLSASTRRSATPTSRPTRWAVRPSRSAAFAALHAPAVAACG